MGRLLKPDGDRIRSLRLRKGWPREQLAQIAGVSVRAIRKVEAGNSVSFEALRAIAGAFGKEVHELMRGLPGASSRTQEVSGRLLRILSAETLAATVAWCMPYAPAAKGLMTTFAMIVLAASAVALAPLLADRDEDIIIVASSQSLLPAPLPAPVRAIEETPGRQARLSSAYRALIPRTVRFEKSTQPDAGNTLASEAPVQPNAAAGTGAPPAEHSSPATAPHVGLPASTVQAIAGVMHNDWLKNLSQPVSTPRDFFWPMHSQARPALSHPSAENNSNRGGGGGYSVLGKPFVRSGKSTAAFFTKVGSSIKRAF